MMYFAQLAGPWNKIRLPFLNQQLASTACSPFASSAPFTSKNQVLSPSINLYYNMNIIIKRSLFRFATSIPLSLAYPFEYTLLPDQFAFMDIRFTQIPLTRELAKPERQHIHSVLQRFGSKLNGDKSQNEVDRQYIFKCLKSKVSELKTIQSESKFDLAFTFDLGTVTKSSGYLQIKPKQNVSLLQKDLEFIHRYRFTREKESLDVQLKNKKQTISQEEQLKKDILEKLESPTNEIREQIQKMQFSKEAVFYNRLVDGLLSIGKKQVKKSQFQDYFIVDQIKGVFSCSMKFDGKTYTDNEVTFDSKWLYHVQNLESDDLKKYRRRKLFDFQFWNRGSFFPIRNFAGEIAELE